MQFIVASALLRNSLSIEEWLAAATFMKYCTLKNFSLRLTARKQCLAMATLLWITVFSYKSLLNILLRFFLHLSIIAAPCYFSVYKLIGWDTANIYLFKFNSRALEEIVNYVQS